jgi:PAS domain S-box-containing protein
VLSDSDGRPVGAWAGATSPAAPAPHAQPLTVLHRAVFDASTDGMLVVGRLPEQATVTIIDVNPALCAMTGYAAADLLGADPLRLVVPADHRRAGDAIAASWRDEQAEATVAIMRQDGATVDVELHAGPLHYRGLRHGLIVVRDITERVQAFRALEQRV